MDKNLDRLLEPFGNIFVKGNEFGLQGGVAKPAPPGDIYTKFSVEILAHRQHSGRSEGTKLLRQFADYASKKTLGCVHVVGSFFLQIPPLGKDAPWRPAHTINITQSECSRSAGSSSIRPSP
jgi:hypothetical protein